MSNPNEFDSLDVSIFEFDIDPTDEANLDGGSDRVAVIRTSDRGSYMGCRRRWGWTSHLKGNLRPKSDASPLWFGSGIHFALEDYHGKREYDTIIDAFHAYVEATKRYNRAKVPADFQEHIVLGEGMLDYYVNDWLKYRDPLKTFVWKGVPQVEVNFRIDIPWPRGKYGYDRVVYSGTIDRVVIDEEGLLWGVEYKTAKIIQLLHLATDGQVSSYVWAGNHLYPGYTFAGIYYQQHRKVIPHEPQWTANGFSTAQNQLTSPKLYREALIKVYGKVENAPGRNIEYLNKLISWEDIDFTKYVRRDRARRNEHQCQAEGTKIMMQIEEMLNPDTPLYPHPERSCAFLCPFNGPCVTLDDGGDWEYELDALMTKREKEYDEWRKYLPKPQNLPRILLAEAKANQPLFP